MGNRVLHGIRTINFLFETSFDPFTTVSEINDYFETKSLTVSQKSKSIQDMFNMSYFDSDFSTAQMSDQSPLNNMVIVDGYFVPLDSLPKEYQEMVRQARAEGEDIEFHTE